MIHAGSLIREVLVHMWDFLLHMAMLFDVCHLCWCMLTVRQLRAWNGYLASLL